MRTPGTAVMADDERPVLGAYTAILLYPKVQVDLDVSK
jgi:hypothetical protein